MAEAWSKAKKADELKSKIQDIDPGGTVSRNTICISGEDKAGVDRIREVITKAAPGLRVVDMSLDASSLLNPAARFQSVSCSALFALVAMARYGLRLPAHHLC